MKSSYPEGRRWTDDSFYAWKGGIFTGGYGCVAFSFTMSDAAFGTKKATMHTNVNNIKVGDILRVENNSHTVVVLKIYNNCIEVVEGNYNSSIHWGRLISMDELRTNCSYIITRY